MVGAKRPHVPPGSGAAVHSACAGIPLVAVTPPDPRPPTLDEEIARLAAQRDRLERWLEKLMREGETAQAMRGLALLSQVTKNLAALLLRRQGDGNEELDRFLEEVTREARTLTGDAFGDVQTPWTPPGP